jgi:hypothetical protein
MRSWLNGQTSPEMLYLETKWASLIPFARTRDLLKEVLPVGDLVNAETVRNHLQLTAERIEQELSEERQLNRFEGSEQEWEQQPLPDGPITVGIDGGYVRAAHKQGWFEVIAGKSVVAFRRDDEGEEPSAKCFGFVQTYDANGALEMAPLPHIPFERSRKAKTIFCGLEKAGLESVIRCIPRSGLVQFPKCRVEQNAE